MVSELTEPPVHMVNDDGWVMIWGTYTVAQLDVAVLQSLPDAETNTR